MNQAGQSILQKKTTWLLLVQGSILTTSYCFFAYINLYVYLIYDFLIMDYTWIELFALHSIATGITAIVSIGFALTWPETRKTALRIVFVALILSLLFTSLICIAFI